MSDLDRYLLATERSVAVARRHWAVLLPQVGAVVGSWLVWLWVLSGVTSVFLASAALFYLIFSLLWLAWWMGEWWREVFAVTDKRILLVNGLLYKRVAVMPLAKVTDLTYERSPAGRLFGYGTFVFESAGQDQALSRIDYVADPETLYRRLSEELFGRRRASGAKNPATPDPPPAAAPTTDRLPRVP